MNFYAVPPDRSMRWAISTKKPVLGGTRLKSLAVLSVLLSLVQSPGSSGIAQTPLGHLEGVVVEATTSKPVSGVQVILRGHPASARVSGQAVAEQVAALVASTNGQSLSQSIALLQQQLGAPAGTQTSTLTDAGGRFRFSNIGTGWYSLQAQREGFFSPKAGIDRSGATRVVSTAFVETQQAPTPLVLSMVAGGRIGGRVRGPDGQPVSNMNVIAYSLDYHEGNPVLNVEESKSTDDRGEYRLFWLPPGDYYVAAVPPRPAAEIGPRDSWRRTFFPGITAPRLGNSIQIRGGSEVEGADIHIQASPLVNVSGTVIDALTESKGQSEATARTFFIANLDRILLADDSVQTFTNLAGDQKNGRFLLRLHPGQYELVTTIPNSKGRAFPGRTRLDVGNSDINNVTITVTSGVPVSARVVSNLPKTGTAPAIRLQLSVNETIRAPFNVLVMALPVLPTPGTPLAVPFLAPDGSFVFPNVPEAHYRMTITGMPQGAYVEDIRMGGVSVYDSGIEVGRQSPAQIEVVVTPGAGRVNGTVYESPSRAATSGGVVLIPQGSHQRNPSLYKTAIVSRDGRFSLTGIAPGEYKVFAWDSVKGTAYLNEEFLAKYASRGKSVRVTANASLEERVELIRTIDERN